MPTNVVDIHNATGHFTNAQKTARAAAQQAVTRAKVRLTAPKPIREDAAAYGYWKSTLRRMRGITLLDDLDSEMLAMYCQILSRRDALSAIWQDGNRAVQAAGSVDQQLEMVRDLDDILKRLEAQERLAIQYAEKLGLTPSGRVRLAKRRAEEKAVDPEADLYGDGE